MNNLIARPGSPLGRIIMNRRAPTLGWTLLVLAFFGAPLSAGDQQSGTLVFDVESYASEVKLDKNTKKQLQHFGIEWGIVDDMVVIPLVKKAFLKPEIPYFTRYGEQKTLQVEPGEYNITCIGYVHSSNSRDVDKVLSKSAFFNNAVLTFTVLPGKTTTVEIFPTYQRQTKWSLWLPVRMFLPDLNVRVIEDEVQKVEKVINRRTTTSVAWDDYGGPLKR